MQRILPPRYSSRLGVNRNSGVLRKINLKESNVNTDTLTWRDKEK